MGVKNKIARKSGNKHWHKPDDLNPVFLNAHFPGSDLGKYGNPAENPEEEVLLEEEIDTGSGEIAHLLVYNDDHNSFDWVIECFMDILQHTSEQAEQLALIIHLKGKATVKTAPRNVLQPKKEALIDRGLSAVIEGERQ